MFVQIGESQEFCLDGLPVRIKVEGEEIVLRVVDGSDVAVDAALTLMNQIAEAVRSESCRTGRLKHEFHERGFIQERRIDCIRIPLLFNERGRG